MAGFKIKIERKLDADVAVQWLAAYDVAYSYSDDVEPVPGVRYNEQYYRVYRCNDRRGVHRVASLLSGGFFRMRVVDGDIIIPSNAIG